MGRAAEAELTFRAQESVQCLLEKVISRPTNPHSHFLAHSTPPFSRPCKQKVLAPTLNLTRAPRSVAVVCHCGTISELTAHCGERVECGNAACVTMRWERRHREVAAAAGAVGAAGGAAGAAAGGTQERGEPAVGGGEGGFAVPDEQAADAGYWELVYCQPEGPPS